MAKRTLKIPNWKLCDLFGMERDGPEIWTEEVEWKLKAGARSHPKVYEDNRERETGLTGARSRRGQAIMWDGKFYPTKKAAAQALGLPYMTFINRYNARAKS